MSFGRGRQEPEQRFISRHSPDTFMMNQEESGDEPDYGDPSEDEETFAPTSRFSPRSVNPPGLSVGQLHTEPPLRTSTAAATQRGQQVERSDLQRPEGEDDFDSPWGTPAPRPTSGRDAH